MRIEQLYYFMEICQTNSLNEAAKKLYISQPALTQTIKALENELNVQLFDRNQKGIFPTETCLIFAEHVKTIIAEYEQALADIHRTRHFQEALNICVPPALTNLYAQFISQDLHHTFPDLDIHFREVLFENLYEFLEEHLYTIALVVTTDVASKIQEGLSVKYIPLGEDYSCAYVSRYSPYVQFSSLDFQKLQNAKCISLRNFNNIYDNFHPDIINDYSQNLSLIQQLIITQSAIFFFPNKLGKILLSHSDIIAIPRDPFVKLTYQLIVRKEILSSEFQPIITHLTNHLRQIFMQ